MNYYEIQRCLSKKQRSIEFEHLVFIKYLFFIFKLR